MYWNLRISMILSETLVKAKNTKGMFVKECSETPDNTCTYIGSIANIYSLYNLTFNLAIKMLMQAYVKLKLFYTCDTVLHILLCYLFTCMFTEFISILIHLPKWHICIIAYAMEYYKTERLRRKLGYV